MNTPLRYRRHEQREDLPAQQGQPDARPVDELAIHRDPSLPASQGVPAPPAARPGVGWVRPTELAALAGSRVAGRGIDLQAELVRRARRAPLVAAQSVRRTMRAPAAASPTASIPTAQTQTLGVSL